MKTVEKKINIEFFDDIFSGKKKFELRLNDEDISEGDTLVLNEWDPDTKTYTGRKMEKKVTYAKVFNIDKMFWSEAEIKAKGLRILSLE
ncbi:MAG TPA: DUF3850 domain-containing protein [Candidatus Paceibacterota bacterium]|nr:DUF3850 domain-containing protein [Candidatus Paceibacterota bacterium]